MASYLNRLWFGPALGAEDGITLASVGRLMVQCMLLPAVALYPPALNQGTIKVCGFALLSPGEPLLIEAPFLKFSVRMIFDLLLATSLTLLVAPHNNRTTTTALLVWAGADFYSEVAEFYQDGCDLAGYLTDVFNHSREWAEVKIIIV